MGWITDGLWVRFPARKRDFSQILIVIIFSGVHLMGKGALSQVIMWMTHEAFLDFVTKRQVSALACTQTSTVLRFSKDQSN